MRSIKARYVFTRARYPEQYSSYLCFVYATKGQGFSYEILSKWFNLLVDKNEYALNERKGIVDYLHHLSNEPEEQEFWGKNSPESILNDSYDNWTI